MGLNATKDEKKQGAIPPEGLTQGVCYSIIDLGTQIESFPGKPSSEARKVHISWELPQLPHVVFNTEKGPQIMAVFQEYTVSASEKAKFPKVLASWARFPVADLKSITSDFLKKFIGQSCMLNIVHTNSKTAKDSTTGAFIKYANIGQNGLAVMPHMEGIPKPTGTVNPAKFMDLDFFDWKVYGSLPQFLQDKIAKCKEWPAVLAKFPKPVDATQGQQTATVNPQNSMASLESASPVVHSGPSVDNPFA